MSEPKGMKIKAPGIPAAGIPAAENRGWLIKGEKYGATEAIFSDAQKLADYLDDLWFAGKEATIVAVISNP